MSIIAYKYLGILLIPIIKLNLFLRVLQKKEDKKRLSERYGISSIKRPAGDLIWIHASSVGEFKSSSPIINNYYKKYNILVTTTTLSAANYAMKNYKNKIIHQFAPLDIIFWVDKFISKWNPKLVIWIESDLWPITLISIKKNCIKSILINARMSPQSYEKWKGLSFFYKEITSNFKYIYAQSPNDQKRISKLTNRNISFIGNLKLSSENYKQKITLNHKLKKLKTNKILMLASTHYDEEIQFIPTLKKLISKISNIKIIIAPRHPERSMSIKSIYEKKGIKTKLVDKYYNFNEDVIIVNNFGTLPLYFYISDVVFLGGSLIKKGGHNPIEPSINNCAVLTGPYIYNWEDVFKYMSKKDVCYLCKNIFDLEKKIFNLFQNIDKMKKMKKNSKIIAKKQLFDSKRLIKNINKLIMEKNFAKSS